jgi:hypothetical protein
LRKIAFVNRAHNNNNTVPFVSFERDKLIPPLQNARGAARTRSQQIRPERTTKTTTTTTRESLKKPEGKKKEGKRRNQQQQASKREKPKKRTLLPTVSGNKIPPLVFVAATALSTKTLSSSGINFFAAWLIFSLSLSLPLSLCAYVGGGGFFFCDDFSSFFGSSPPRRERVKSLKVHFSVKNTTTSKKYLDYSSTTNHTLASVIFTNNNLKGKRRERKQKR